MKVQNYEIKADTLFNAVGYVKELGDYAGRYSQEAYDALEIDGELENEWCDLMVADNGKIYAVAGDAPGHAVGNFYFKEIFDGVKGDGELLESISKELARYNVYYQGTDSIDYSIRFLELPNEVRLIYPTREDIAYISSEEELEEAMEDKEQYNEEDGYWS